MKFKGLTIGVPAEIMKDEKRVSQTPDTVAKLVKEGAVVLVETKAGEGAHFSDEDYRNSGALIVFDVCELYDRSDLILKVKEPQFNIRKDKHEADMMHKGQYLVTFLHPASPSNHNMVRTLAANGIISLTLDGIPRISRAQNMDALTSMSTVAGYKSVLLAANRLSKFLPMMGTAVGMIRPAEVFVIGAGVAGLQAIATAKRLGASVKAADIRADACEQAGSLGAKITDTGVPDNEAVAAGGYAKHLKKEFLEIERNSVRPTVINSDIIVLTALVPGKIAPILITEEMVKAMKPGSVIMDVAIDQGGNCEITEAGRVIEKYGVIIDGTKNIPGMLPVSSTWMFANNVFNLVNYIAKNGKIELDEKDEIISSSIVTRDGVIIHSGAKEAMGG